MQISSRFTIAVHVLICIETFKEEHKITSDFLASSVNANSVIIRKLLQQLKKAGIVAVIRGSGGADICKSLDEAVECVEDGKLFHFHENPNPLCPVGRNIHSILDARLEQIQMALEKEMKSVTIQDIVNDSQKMIAEEKV